MTPRERELERQLQQCQEELASARRENQLLREKIDSLVRRVFGSSSERLERAQLELLLQMPEAPCQELAPTPEKQLRLPFASRRRERTPRLPQNLPIVEEVIDPQPVKEQPGAWRCIGQEVSEQLDYEPGRFLCRRTIRRKYVHRILRDMAPLIAPLPQRLLDRSLPAPGLLAQLLVSKYCDHLPLYRQEQIFLRRHGVHLPRQTLARWVGLAAEWLKPIYEHIRTGVLGGGYVQIDETPIRYLEPGFGRARQGYLWTSSRPDGDVFYRWETSRAAACLEQIIPRTFTGTLQCDGYSAYRAFANKRGQSIQLAGCWAHVRRKFYEALECSAPRTAAWMVRQIQHLYSVEAQLREQRAGPQLRQAVRASQSRPIVQRIQRGLIQLKGSGRHLPQSLLGQAIDYALSQWNTLELYLENGRVEIDTNLVENAIRPTAVGKKNWLFIGEAAVGERSAILYTVIESCRRRGLDPYRYLREVLSRLPNMTNRQIPESTPEAWSKSQDSLLRQTLS
jgi:transposase